MTSSTVPCNIKSESISTPAAESCKSRTESLLVAQRQQQRQQHQRQQQQQQQRQQQQQQPLVETMAPPRRKQIYYLSRTHTQLKQVISQLRTLHPSLIDNLTMTLLGSKEHLCINPKARDFKNYSDKCNSIEDACGDMREKKSCSLFHTANNLALELSRTIHDIEDCVNMGLNHKACPYFATRTLADDADIVFAPYNYILDQGIKKACGINVKGKIVVVDEGHNIAEVCRSGMTFSFSDKKLLLASLQFKRLAEKKGEMYTKMQNLLEAFRKWLTSKVAKISSFPPQGDKTPTSQLHNVLEPASVMLDFHQELGLNMDTIAVYDDFLTQITAELNDRFAGVNSQSLDDEAGSDEENDKVETLTISTLNLIGTLFIICKLLLRRNEKDDGFMHHDSYKVIIDCDDGNTGGGGRRGQVGAINIAAPDPSVRFCCLNAALGFKEAVGDAHSVLITSGTLSPTLSFAGELGTVFKHIVEAKHVIETRQIMVGAVGSYGNQSLLSTFKCQNDLGYQDAVLETIVGASSLVPTGSGTLVFFPSYHLMEKMHRRWIETGQFDQLRCCFLEPRSTNQCDMILKSYLETIKRGESALLLCVYKGKVSEGLDFADEKARLVMLVGIPYAPAMDTEVRLQREYQDRAYRLAVQSGDAGALQIDNGDKWYETQAWRAVNQAIGRCIRHKNDWGALVFLDPRFKTVNAKGVSMLSKWMREELRDYDGYGSMHLGLKLFMSDLSKNPPGGAGAGVASSSSVVEPKSMSAMEVLASLGILPPPHASDEPPPPAKVFSIFNRAAPSAATVQPSRKKSKK